MTKDRKILLLIIIGIIGILIFGALFKQGIDEIIDTLRVPILSQQEVSQKLPLREVALNQSFTAGSIKYTFTHFMDIGNNIPFYGITEGRFIEVRFEAENIGKETEKVSPKLEVIDDKQRVYGPSMQATAMKHIQGYSDYSYGSEGVRPGFTEKYMWIFEVAPDSQNLTLEIGGVYKISYD